MTDPILPLVVFYAHEGLGRHIQVLCTEAIRRKPRGGDANLQLWRAYGMFLEGSYSEALRDLQALASYAEVAMPRMILSIHAHRQARVVDEETVEDLALQLQNEEQNATERALYVSALLLWLTGEPGKAEGYCRDILRVQPNYHQASVLLAWIQMLSAREVGASYLRAFEEAVDPSTPDVLASFGRFRCLDFMGEMDGAMGVLNEIIVHFPWFFPALSEKIKLLLKAEEWEEALEIAQKLLQDDTKNLDGHLFVTVHLLAREGRASMAQQRLEDMQDIIESVEPRNHRLLFETSRLLARLSMGNVQILKLTEGLIKKAIKLAPECSDYWLEHGYQLQLCGDCKGAISLYTQAGQINDMDTRSLYATLQCQILQGHVAEAQAQLQFLQEMGSEAGDGSEVDFHFSKALLLGASSADLEEIHACIQHCFVKKTDLCNGTRPSYDFIVNLNPPMILQMVHIVLDHCPSDHEEYLSKIQSVCLSESLQMLELLITYVPGLTQAQLIYAKCLFLSGNTEKAKQKISEVIRLNPTDSDARILISQIYINQGNTKAAIEELELAVSHDFQIRNSPMYKLTRAKLYTVDKNYEEAIALLEDMLQPQNSEVSGKAAMSLSSFTMTSSDRASVYLLLITSYSMSSKLEQGKAMIAAANKEFKGTTEEIRIIIAECELLLQTGNTKLAIRKLEAVGRDSPYFASCKRALAEIYLKHLGRKDMFTKCHMEIADRRPSVSNFITLGEAFMQIQDPMRAISAYENALRLNPKDGVLPSKIGKALISTHDYHRAVDYYERSVKNDQSNLMLQFDLADLYYKLRRHDLSERACLNIKDTVDETNDTLENISVLVQVYMLLSSLYRQKQNTNMCIENMVKAKHTQLKLLQRSKVEHRSQILHENQATCSICMDIGKEYSLNRMHRKALEYYEEALQYDTDNPSIMLTLAKTFLLCGNPDSCQKYCSKVLGLDHNNEEATMMLAELLFQKEEYQTSIFHFQQILGKSPTNYQALFRMIHLLRRTGRLNEAHKYLDAASGRTMEAKPDAGLSFCKGIYMRYMKKPWEAVSLLNLARKDREYGTMAIVNMVEIYLNPHNHVMYNSNRESSANNDDLDAATSLIQEIKGHPTVEHHVLQCYIDMEKGTRMDIDHALVKLVEMANENPDNVPVLLAMASAFMLIKQVPKARNQLKRIAKMTYNVEDAEEFERAWLLLLEIYVQGGKYDLAQELAKKCIKYNKSCGRAWQYLGQIYEREQAYKDAADYYVKAWNLENETNPELGFRLAFNYLKAKRYVEAIDICKRVLETSPDYPKIRKEILEKAQINLRA